MGRSFQYLAGNYKAVAKSTTLFIIEIIMPDVDIALLARLENKEFVQWIWIYYRVIGGGGIK